MSPVPRKPKRVLTAEQKYDLLVVMLSGQITRAQAAAEAGVDRSVIFRLRAIARDGAIAGLASSRPGRRGQVRLEGSEASEAAAAVLPGTALSEPEDSDRFFSRPVIDGPVFCVNRSLGGPLTYAFDGDGDGVADTCSLLTTRREAVARQLAMEKLAARHPGSYESLFAEACRMGPQSMGEPEAEAADDCEEIRSEVQAPVVPPVAPRIPTAATSPRPELVSAPEYSAVSISAGSDHTCVVSDDAHIVCWGSSDAV